MVALRMLNTVLMATGSDCLSAEDSHLESLEISYFEKQCTVCTADGYENSRSVFIVLRLCIVLEKSLLKNVRKMFEQNWPNIGHMQGM